MNVPARANRPPARPVVIFDGDCSFCRRWITRWRQSTGDAFDYVALQDAEALGCDAELSRTQLEQAIHLVEPDGRISSGAEAIFRAWQRMGERSWPLQFYERFDVVASLAEWFYRLVARNRRGFCRCNRKA